MLINPALEAEAEFLARGGIGQWDHLLHPLNVAFSISSK